MSFHGIAPLDPAGKSLVENFHVAITLFVENAVSQTGQVTRARSVKNHQFVFRDNGKLQGDLIQRNREGAFDVGGVVLLRAADIDDQGLLFLDNLIHEFVQLDKFRGDALGELVLGELGISARVGKSFRGNKQGHKNNT